MIQLTHDTLGFFGIIPEFRILSLFLKLYNPDFSFIVVKDTP
jgi:hypothetical protein